MTLFVATVVTANWLLVHVGVVDVGFGFRAPAGVYVAGLAFTFRDLLQNALGRGIVILAIIIGAIVSGLVSARFALASGTAFLVSETADFAVYTPLRESGRWLLGVLASNVVGLAFDSGLFLWLAYRSLKYLPGLVIGKIYVTLGALMILYPLRHWRQVAPAEGSSRAK
jgi:uncharacterized PurR-regulated membrane protein YhhQ (DUF165 family)